MPDAPFDPDAFIQQNKIRPPRGQKKDFDPDAFLKSHPSEDSDPGEVAGFVRGVGKGLVSPVVGAGQIAEDVFPGTAAGVRAIPGVSSAAHAAKEFVMSPNQTWGESAGNIVGEAAPWAAGALAGVDEAAGGAWLLNRAAPYLSGRSVALTRPAQWLANMASRAGFGGAAGGVQATESGDLTSHAKGAGVGALAGGATHPAIAGPTVGALTGEGLTKLASVVGWGPIIGALSGTAGPLGLYLGSHYGLHALARRAGNLAGKAIPRGSAGTAGAVGGQSVRGQAQEDDGE